MFSHGFQASVDMNVKCNTAEVSMFTPLHVAALSSCWSELECLVGWGAALDPADHLGNTPLFIVISQTRSAAAKLTSPTLKKVNNNNYNNYYILCIDHAVNCIAQGVEYSTPRIQPYELRVHSSGRLDTCIETSRSG